MDRVILFMSFEACCRITRVEANGKAEPVPSLAGVKTPQIQCLSFKINNFVAKLVFGSSRVCSLSPELDRRFRVRTSIAPTNESEYYVRSNKTKDAHIRVKAFKQSYSHNSVVSRPSSQGFSCSEYRSTFVHVWRVAGATRTANLYECTILFLNDASAALIQQCDSGSRSNEFSSSLTDEG